MDNTGFLSREDVRRLTGAARASGQEAWLRSQSIPCKRRDSEVLVLWTHVEAWIEDRQTPVPVGPNWAAFEELERQRAAKRKNRKVAGS